MSTVKAKNHQIGSDGTASNNFTIYQPSTPDGTSRWAVGVSGATTKDMVTINSTNITLGGNLIQASTAAPAFSAWQSSAQTLSSSTITKLQFQTEEFDTANAFDNTTNYRFTPQVAGYYQVNGSLRANTSFNTMQVILYKNGNSYKAGNYVQTNMGQSTVSCLVYLNGTTDFIELYGIFATGQLVSNQQPETYFQAAMVRSA